MVTKIDTLIVGAGQAGLSLSYYLTQQNRPHVLLERAAQLAEPWRNHRWDSFTLITPNTHLRLPGYEYQGNEPGGYMPRADVVRYIEDYAASFNAPVHLGVSALSVEAFDHTYQVQTSEGDYEAANVVIATGLFQKPRIPAYHTELPASIRQYHSSEYRNPDLLPPGAVLVVGSAQSGCQIAEELYQSRRKVYLCVGGSSGRVPRRYRGQDAADWLTQMGFFDRTVDKLPSPRAKYAGNPQLSGKDGGHTINLHQFVRDGVTLLGRITSVQGNKIILAPNLKENLAKIDKFEVDLVKGIDDFIARSGLNAPEETLPQLREGYAVEELTELDLLPAGVTSIIWAIGYKFDFTWIHLPILDEDGYPIQQRGITAYPGLYFVGLHWLYKLKSGLFLGVGEDAAHIAKHLATRA